MCVCVCSGLSSLRTQALLSLKTPHFSPPLHTTHLSHGQLFDSSNKMPDGVVEANCWLSMSNPVYLNDQKRVSGSC